MRAARTVFGARGYHAATIEDIADEAGGTRGDVVGSDGEDVPPDRA